MVDTEKSLSHVLDTLEDLPTSPPSLYIDLEGINLSRLGSISILQLHVLPLNKTHLIDVHTMKETAFTTPNSKGRTLKGILESDFTLKVFFDIRNDSDALFSHYGVRVAGIVDLQLMELATRTFPRKFIVGLGKCIERDSGLTLSERTTWLVSKEKGLKLFAPEKGGSYEVFNQRPLAEGIRDYCLEDVRFLPRLWRIYDGKLKPAWRERVKSATVDRIRLSQSPTFNGKGRHMALPPAGWGA
ncbi:ribonuclease H-like domain-containing protein [Xylariales sp. AK1849]|nr:ribonuclease H-like domain-containing protein [Xylariales sp. AK1849]